MKPGMLPQTVFGIIVAVAGIMTADALRISYGPANIDIFEVISVNK